MVVRSATDDSLLSPTTKVAAQKTAMTGAVEDIVFGSVCSQISLVDAAFEYRFFSFKDSQSASWQELRGNSLNILSTQ